MSCTLGVLFKCKRRTASALSLLSGSTRRSFEIRSCRRTLILSFEDARRGIARPLAAAPGRAPWLRGLSSAAATMISRWKPKSERKRIAPKAHMSPAHVACVVAPDSISGATYELSLLDLSTPSAGTKSRDRVSVEMCSSCRACRW